MTKILILLAIAAGLVFWWRRRQFRPPLPPVDENYVCPHCDEKDCTCHQDPDKETRNQP
jgi:hypothetical protein